MSSLAGTVFLERLNAGWFAARSVSGVRRARRRGSAAPSSARARASRARGTPHALFASERCPRSGVLPGTFCHVAKQRPVGPRRRAVGSMETAQRVTQIAPSGLTLRSD